MNRLIIGLGAIASLALPNLSIAANGSVAATMAKEHWLATQRNEAQARKINVVAQGQAVTPVALTRPPADSPRRVR